MIHITATLKDIFGTAIENGALLVQLCNFGSELPRVSGTSMVAKTAPLKVESAANGTIAFDLTGNDAITPAGTYYTIQVQDENGNVIQINAYQFTGSSPVDLSAATPYLLT